MFQRPKTVREPRPAGSEAMAAAFAIGKTLEGNKGVPNQDKTILRNKTVGSAQQSTGSTNRNSVKKTMSLREFRVRPPERTSSIPGRGSNNTSEYFDAEEHFTEFGGVQAAGVVKQVRQKEKENENELVTKYVPGPRGLVKVTMSVPKVSSPSRGSSINRKQKPAGGSFGRRSLPNFTQSSVSHERGTFTPQSPLATPTKNEHRSSAGRSPGHARSSSDSKLGKRPKALKETPPRTTKSTHVVVQSPLKFEAGSETGPAVLDAKEEKCSTAPRHTDISVVLEEDENLDSTPALKCSEASNQDEGTKEETKESQRNGKDEGVALENGSLVSEGSMQSGAVESVARSNAAASVDPQEGRKDRSVTSEKLAKGSDSTNEDPKNLSTVSTSSSSKVYSLRSPSTDHKRQGDIAVSENRKESINSSTSVDTLKKTSKEKSTSPIKSALKHASSDDGKDYTNYVIPSAAEGAYLSLATAENTRLNARMSRENLVKAATSRTPSRNRNSVLSVKSVDKPPAKTIGINIPKSKVKNSKQKRGSPAQKSTVTKGNSSLVSRSSNYKASKVPYTTDDESVKKSSFERERPQQQKNMGFKLLSLRDSVLQDQAASKVEDFHQQPYTPSNSDDEGSIQPRNRRSNNNTPHSGLRNTPRAGSQLLSSLRPVGDTGTPSRSSSKTNHAKSFKQLSRPSQKMVPGPLFNSTSNISPAALSSPSKQALPSFLSKSYEMMATAQPNQSQSSLHQSASDLNNTTQRSPGKTTKKGLGFALKMIFGKKNKK